MTTISPEQADVVISPNGDDDAPGTWSEGPGPLVRDCDADGNLYWNVAAPEKGVVR